MFHAHGVCCSWAEASCMLLHRLAYTQAAVDEERDELSSRLQEERAEFDEIHSYLKHELREQTRRAEALKEQLGAAQAALRAAEQAGAAALAAAERRRAADVAEVEMRLGEQKDRQVAADRFLDERDALQARITQLQAQLEEQAQLYTRRQMVRPAHIGQWRHLWPRRWAWCMFTPFVAARMTSSCPSLSTGYRAQTRRGP